MGDRVMSDDEAELRKLYQRLRRRAAELMGERSDLTIQATELVQEAYLSLVRSGRHWRDSDFFPVATAALRHALLQHLRRRDAIKRGRGRARLTFDEENLNAERASELEVLDLYEALEELRQLKPEHAQVAELRFLCGFTIPETAKALCVDPIEVQRAWSRARPWLNARLRSADF